MSDDKVMIDPGLRPPPDGGDSRRPRWHRIVVIAIAVLVFGWVLRSPPSRPPEGVQPIAEMADAPDPSPIRQLGTSDVPLGELLPGFVDTVTILTWGTRGVDVLRWPASLPAPETLLSLDHGAGWNRSLDASGRWLVEMGSDSNLTIHPVADTATGLPRSVEMGWSVVWHDTRPGRLAWLSCPAATEGSIATINIVDMVDSAVEGSTLPLIDIPCEDARVWLTRWGDWGLLLQRADETGMAHILMSAGGTRVATGALGPEGEWFVGTGPDGATVWTEGLGTEESSSFILSSDGLECRPVPGLLPGERLESAVVSPDGSRLALLPDLTANFGSVVRVAEAGSGAVVAEIDQPSWWVTRMVWSTDGRFLIYERWPDVTANWAGVPHDVELVFYDTVTATGVALPLPGYAPALRSGAP